MVTLDIFHLIFRCVKPTELMTPTNKVRCRFRRRGDQQLTTSARADRREQAQRPSRPRGQQEEDGGQAFHLSPLTLRHHGRSESGGSPLAFSVSSSSLKLAVNLAGQAAVHHAQAVDPHCRRRADNGQHQEEQGQEDPARGEWRSGLSLPRGKLTRSLARRTGRPCTSITPSRRGCRVSTGRGRLLSRLGLQP